MGIFDFLKKIIKEEPGEKEKIAFSEAENWIEQKSEKNKEQEKEILEIIKNRIDELNSKISQKIKELEEINVDEKKVEDRFKLLVNENRKRYIEVINAFTENLKSLEKESFEKLIHEIDKSLRDFIKSSNASYEKTTILIGKEISGIKETINRFSKDLVKIINQNKKIIDNSKTISEIKTKLEQISRIEKILGKINETIKEIESGIGDKKRENQKLGKEIDSTKKSPEYLNYLKEKKGAKSLKEELTRDFFNLKELIDFKSLTNFFHINQKQLNIVKSHKEHFQPTFEENNGESLLALLNESKLNNEKISKQIEKIKSKTEEIKKINNKTEKDKLQELESEVSRIEREIKALENEKESEEKKYSKIESNKKEIINQIKKELGKMNVEVN